MHLLTTSFLALLTIAAAINYGAAPERVPEHPQSRLHFPKEQKVMDVPMEDVQKAVEEISLLGEELKKELPYPPPPMPEVPPPYEPPKEPVHDVPAVPAVPTTVPPTTFK
ncbi:unnamed protein product [Nippostrongylus brasiliensis]|uniref:Secreted protein n=1 Tax=Nippostrongylus brasiliensis TaxID=27835 RepID=A0A0N4YN50_NIPBR|nr:unnamed protein product [Nippostrongylus brasiliensis]